MFHTQQKYDVPLKKRKRKKNKTLIVVLTLTVLFILSIIAVIIILQPSPGVFEPVSSHISGDGILYRSYTFTEQVTENSSNPRPIANKSQSTYDFVDSSGRKLTENSYQDASFSTGFYQSGEKTKSYIAAVKVDGKWGYIKFSQNDSGKIIKDENYFVEPKFDSAEPFYNGIAAVISDGKYGYINLNGEYVISPRYEAAKYYSFGYMPVLENGSWKYIDRNKSVIFGPYEDAESFSEGYACVKQNNLWGIIDTNGNFVVEPKYQDIWSVHDGKYYIFEDDIWTKLDIRDAYN